MLLLVSESTNADPVEAIIRRVRDTVLRAFDAGWTGPPFDPLKLADLLKIEVVPRADVPDAQTVPVGAERARIEFNPNRPRGRVRYSIAHELAHTLFPDCTEQLRRRARHGEMEGDDWQLEALCNIGAAEILMPFGSLPGLSASDLEMEKLLELRRKFDVSTEALFLRAVQLADVPCLMFCASRVESGSHMGRYRVDYTINSRAWRGPRLGAIMLPSTTSVSECTAIGFTASSTEEWDSRIGRQRVQAVGVAPYPGRYFPRVLGMLRPLENARAASSIPCIAYVRGDALQPRGQGHRMIVHVVNDKTPNWGGSGFAQSLRREWPEAQGDFRTWVASQRGALSLGRVRVFDATDNLSIASLVAQKGYGPSASPRIRYAALKQGLDAITTEAASRGATLHMPRIATGQAGGIWPMVEDILRMTVCSADLLVTVYDLPGAVAPLPPKQGTLPLFRPGPG